MTLEQEVLELVTQLVDQVLMELADVAWPVKEVDGMEGAAEVAEYGSELGKLIVDSTMRSVPVTEPTVPESELGTELVTVDSSYHLHKIVQMVLLVEVTRRLGLTSRSSTCSPENLANDQETWPGMSSLAALSDDG